MIKQVVIGAMAVGVALAVAPAAAAEPDPHIPNGAANWCHGGQYAEYGGARNCLGLPFPDGSVYVQLGSFGSAGPFGRWTWHSGAQCKIKLADGRLGVGGYNEPTPNCNGPEFLNF